MGPSCSENRRNFHRAGFTLIELLVVLGIVALLVALILPALGKARSSSRAASSLANARSLVAVLHLYADQNRDLLPAITEGESIPGMNRDARLGFPYWQVYETWTGVVFDLLPYNEHLPVFLSPGSPRLHNYETCWPTSYYYSTSFVADPRTWEPGATADPALLRRCKLSATAFPSQKAMLWDQEAAFLRGKHVNKNGDILDAVPVAMADTAVSLRKPAEATPAAFNPFPAPRATMRLGNTPKGQLGIDY